MTAPAEVVDDIAGAVLGGRPLPSGHPGRTDALAAMAALGYSTAYMGEQLGVQPKSVGNIASKARVRLDPQRGFVDHLAVTFALQGTPMRLRGVDMDRAIVLLAKRGKCAAEIARLLRADPSTVSKHAADLGVDLPEDAGEGCWWAGYNDTRRSRRGRNA